VPQDARVPAPAAGVLQRFRERGGRVIVDHGAGNGAEAKELIGRLQPPWRMVPPSDGIIAGRFARDGRQILVLVNVGGERYAGRLAPAVPGSSWLRLDPASGAIDSAVVDDTGQVPLDIDAHQSILLVQEPAPQAASFGRGARLIPGLHKTAR